MLLHTSRALTFSALSVTQVNKIHKACVNPVMQCMTKSLLMLMFTLVPVFMSPLTNLLPPPKARILITVKHVVHSGALVIKPKILMQALVHLIHSGRFIKLQL